MCVFDIAMNDAERIGQCTSSADGFSLISIITILDSDFLYMSEQ
jgi:hypothetical protein